MSTPDMEVIKEIPGYKLILKAVLKSQLQQLVEQLAAHTDEESIILTASVADGTLSHLGSHSGKSFLEDHEDVKSQFLGYCLRRHHCKKQEEMEQSPHNLAPVPTHYNPGPGTRFNQIGRSLPYAHQSTPKHALLGIRHEPYSVSSRPPRRKSADIINTESSESLSNPAMKIESDNTSSNENITVLPNNMLHTPQPLSQAQDRDEENQTESGSSVAPVESHSEQTIIGDDVTVKVEALSESELELEITGVELASNNLSQENWAHLNFDPSGATGNQTDIQTTQQGYSYGKVLPMGRVSTDNTRRFLENPQVGVDEEALTCPICGKFFHRRSNLKRHMQVHSRGKVFECEQCKKKFAYKCTLKTHQVTHMNEALKSTKLPI